MIKGHLFNIQKFSVNDGPGIRTTVFMKGCPLRCIWCHNPESNIAAREIFFDAAKCTGCRACEAVCPAECHRFTDGGHVFDRSRCTVCGKCAEACMPEALSVVGYEKTVVEVMEEVLKDKIFYDNSGGGITLSGGEPMHQFDFTYALLKAAKEAGLHTCIETCGFAKRENYEKIAPLVDFFLYDYKETDPALHEAFTGVSNALILENLRFLDSIGASIILRCPIIPTKNDRDDHFAGIAAMANSLQNVLEIHIEPYHPLGSGKAAMLDKSCALRDLTFPENETVAAWMQKIESQTKIPVKKA